MSFAKKIFFISSSLLALTLLFWGIYYLSFKKPADKISEIQKEIENEDLANNAVPPRIDKEKGIFSVTQEPVIGPIYLDDDHKIRYYSKDNGKTYDIDPDGIGKQTISNIELDGLIGVYWSPDKNQVISKFSKGKGQYKFYYYNYTSRKSVALKDNLDYVVWHNNDKIFYKYFNPSSKERSLNIANADGTEWEKIVDIDFKDILIAPVPQSGLVSFWNMPDAYSETVFQSVSIVGKSSETLFTGKFGADYLWNWDGTKYLVSHSDARGGTKISLAIINDRGGEYRNLEIPTLVSKCVWSRDNKTVYFALPGSLPDNILMPNDYDAKKFKTADTFWKVDITTGKKERIIDLEKIKDKYDATELFLSPDEGSLFFMNRVDDRLYRISM